MEKDSDLRSLKVLFEKDNFYSGENFNLFSKLGKKKGVLELIKKSVEESKTSSKGGNFENDSSDSKNTNTISASFAFMFLAASLFHDLLHAEISKIFFPILLISLFYFGFYLFVVTILKISNNDIKKNKSEKTFSTQNKLNLQFTIKRASSDEKITVNSEDIQIGDQIFIHSGPLPVHALIIEGAINLYQKSEKGEYSVERKTEENPFILKNSYIMEGEGIALACSNPDTLPSDFMENFKNLKFKIETNENSVVKLPPNFTTTDYELKLFVDYLNNKEGWEQILEEKNCKIERKMLKGTEVPVMRTTATLENFTIDEIFEAIANIDIRKKWDSNFVTFDLIESNQDGSDLLYMALKSPNAMLFQSRDLVQRRRIYHGFPDSTSKLIHFKSVESQKCPVNTTYVRAHTFISGYLIVKKETEPSKANVYVVSQTDIGGAIPKFLVNAVSVKAPKDWITNLNKGCEMVKSGQK